MMSFDGVNIKRSFGVKGFLTISINFTSGIGLELIMNSTSVNTESNVFSVLACFGANVFMTVRTERIICFHGPP